MQEQPVDIPCPICSVPGKVFMIAHVEEIPYFGEHTQVTVMCHSCGWRQTDFIPAEGKKPGGCILAIDSLETLSARVIRSSSCTVKVHELDLEVAPGSNATGYVSNVEGVLSRFKDIVFMVLRDIESELLGMVESEQSDEAAKAEALEALGRLNEMVEFTNCNSKFVISESVTPCAYKCTIAILVNSDTTVLCILSIVLANLTSSAASVALPPTFSSYPK